MRSLPLLGLASLLFIGQTLPVSSASSNQKSLRVVSSVLASHFTGSLIPAGRAFVTKRGGAGVLSFAYGGIPSIFISPNSSVTLRASGDTSNGGRFTRLDISGEVNIAVSTTNPFSEVEVCFRNSVGKRGCGSLKSSARIAPTSEGVVIATREGAVTVSAEDTFQQETIRTGYYSVFKKDGTYTKPTNAFKTVGYSQAYATKGGRNHTVEYRAKEGWRFQDCKTSVRAVLGTVPVMLSPLDTCPQPF